MSCFHLGLFKKFNQCILSLSLSIQNFDFMVMCFSLQGDWVWLKKFKEGHFKEVKQNTIRIFMKVERHVQHNATCPHINLPREAHFAFLVFIF